MHFVREILLSNVKYALRRVDLFHFTESACFLFHNFVRNYFTSTKLIFHLKHIASIVYLILLSCCAIIPNGDIL